MNPKNQLRFCTGGLLILIGSLLGILKPVVNYFLQVAQYGAVSDHLNNILLTNLFTSLATSFISAIPLIVFALMLLLKKKGTPVMVASIILFACSIISDVLVFIGLMTTRVIGSVVTWNWPSIFAITAYGLLMALSISARKPGTGGFRKVWYLPGLVYVLFALATLVNGLLPMFRNLGDFLFDAPSTVLGQYFLRGVLPILLMQLPSLILYTIAYLLAGKWIANPYKKGVQPPVPQPQFRPQYQPVIPQPQYQPPQAPAQAVSLADQELAFHRQRLNAGAITQEEFDTIEKNLKGE